MKIKIYRVMIALITGICVIAGLYINVFGNRWPSGSRDILVSSGNNTRSVKKDTGNFKKINIDTQIFDVSISAGTGYSYVYTCSDDRMVPEVNLADGVLTVKQKEEFQISPFGWMGHNKAALSVTVPSGVQLDSIEISGSVGDTKITGVSSDSIKVDGSVGDVDVTDSAAGRLVCDSSVGDCTVTDSTVGSCSIDTSTGDINIGIKGDKKGYSYDLDTSTGDVEVDGKKYDDDDVPEGSGKNRINAHTSVGDINISFCN